jgi:hypothetical protein
MASVNKYLELNSSSAEAVKPPGQARWRFYNLAVKPRGRRRFFYFACSASNYTTGQNFTCNQRGIGDAYAVYAGRAIEGHLVESSFGFLDYRAEKRSDNPQRRKCSQIASGPSLALQACMINRVV